MSESPVQYRRDSADAATAHTPGATVIAARALGKRVAVGGTPLQILADVSFDIAAGESVAVVGASGSGKSTLLALLAGLDTPTSGAAWLDGVRIDLLDEDDRAAHRAGRIGFVFQSFQLLPAMTALENVMLPLDITGTADAATLARDWLRRVGLGERLAHYPRQLSGGEQQRVAIARAFATAPSILFADEPTGNLDTHTGDAVIDLLFALNHDAGTTLVLVTHDERLAVRCSRTLRLSGGRLVDDSAHP